MLYCPNKTNASLQKAVTVQQKPKIPNVLQTMERPLGQQPAQAPAPIVRETLGLLGLLGQLQLFARKHWFYWDSTTKNATFRQIW